MTVRDYENALVEYEEGSADTGVYKFEVKKDRHGEWLPTGFASGAMYRVLGRRMQFYNFKEGTPSAERETLEAFLQGLDPLPINGVLEIWIGKDAVGYFVRDYRWLTADGVHPAAELPELTREALIRAVVEIKEALSR